VKETRIRNLTVNAVIIAIASIVLFFSSGENEGIIIIGGIVVALIVVRAYVLVKK